jgi:MATE family multidrug resistance protein
VTEPARFGTLVRLAWPIVVARATQSIVGFTDAWLVAPLGQQELAATTTAAIDTYALIILPMGTAYIVQSFAAQLHGRGRAGEARRFAWYGLAIAGIAMLLALAAIPALPWVLGHVDAEPRVRELMTSYMQLRLLSVGAAVGIDVLGNWYAGLGNTRMQLVGGVLTMVSNVVLAWVLIYGRLGAPALGVPGSALAGTIATWLGFAAIAACFHFGVGGVPRAAGPLGLRARELWRVLRFGLPNGINWFLEFAAFMIFLNVVVVHLGTTSLAAMNIVLQINTIAFMPAFGVASAGAILAGQAIGRGARDEVPGIVRLTMRTTAGWMLAAGVINLCVPELLVRQFTPTGADAAALIATGALMLRVSFAWQLFDAIAMTLSEVLRSAGDTTWPMLAKLALAWGAFVPAGVVTVMVLGGGEVGALLCLIGYLAALAGLLAYRFRGGAWRRIELTEAEPALI